MALNNFTSFQDLAASEQQAPRLVSGGVSNGNPNNVRLADRIYGLTPSSKFNSLYEQIYAMNNGGGQYMPGWSQMVESQKHSVTDQDQDSLFDSKGEDEIPKYKKAEGLDQAMIDLQKQAQGIVGLSGFEMKENDPLGSIAANPGGFLASLPLGIISAIPSGISNVYGGITRHDIWHPETGEDGGYKIPDKNLSFTQSAGAIGTGAIDLAGIGFGGSGRLVGSLAKPIVNAGAKALGKEAPKFITNMAEGYISQKVKNPVLGGVLQVGADALEEGAEESTQSLLEDMRDNTLDSGSLGRAASSGILGAIGGGIMSLGPTSINTGRKLANGKQVGDPAALSAQSDNTGIYSTPKDEVFEDLEKSGGVVETPSGRAEGREQARVSRDRVAAGIFRSHKADASLGVHQGDLGSGIIQNLFEFSNANQREIAHRFGFSDKAKNENESVEPGESVEDGVNTLRKVLYENTFNNTRYATQGAAMRAFYFDRKQKGKVDKHGITIGIGRDPVTKGDGSFKIYVRNFTDGRYVALNPLAYTKVGADLDGDQTGVYMNANDLGRITQYISESWRHPEGQGNLDYDFAHIGYRKDTNAAALRQKVSEVNQKYGLDTDYAGLILDALNSDDVNTQLSSVLDRLKNDVNRAKYDPSTNKPKKGMENLDSGHIVSAEVLGVLHGMSEGGIIDFTTSVIDRAQKEAEHTVEEISEEVVSLYKSGKVSGNAVPVDLLEAVNGITSSYVTDKNPIFRQFSTLSFWVHSDKTHRQQQDGIRKILDYVDDTDLFKSLIRASFRMSEVGEHPVNAVTGMIDDLMLTEIMYEYTKSTPDGQTAGLVKTAEDLTRFLEAFVKVYNRYVPVYNTVRKELTTAGWELPYSMPERKEISSWADGSKEGKLATLKAFQKLMGSVNISEWVDVSPLPTVYQDLTLDNYIEYVTAFDGMSDNAFIALGVPEIQSLFTELRNIHFLERQNQSRTLKQQIEGLDTRKLMDSYDTKTGEFDFEYNNFLVGITEFYQNVLGIKEAVKAGLWDLRAAGKTKLGAMLLDVNPDRRLSAVVAIGIHTKYDGVLKDLRSDDAEKQDRALLKLAGMKENPTMAAISRDFQLSFTQTGKPESKLYNMLTNTDYGFKSKMGEFKNWFSEHSGADMLLDSISSDKENPELGSFSKRIDDTGKALATANKSLYDTVVKEVEEAKELLTTMDEHYIEGHFIDAAQNNHFYFNADLIGACVYDAMTFSPKAKEKATIQESATHYFYAVDSMRYGGTFSYTDALFGLEQGNVTEDEFINNPVLFTKAIADPDFSIEVFDPITDSSKTITQQTLFAEYGIELNGKTPTGRQFLQFLEKCPQAAGYFCTTTVTRRTTNGAVSDTITRVETLKESIIRYAGINSTKSSRSKNNEESEKDRRALHEIKRALEATEKFLVDQAWYPTYLVRCAAEELEGARNNPKEISRIMRKYHKEAVSSFYYLAKEDPNGDEYRNMHFDWICKINDAAENDMLRLVTSIVERAGLEHAMLDESGIRENILHRYAENIDFIRFASTSSIIKLNGEDVAIIQPDVSIERKRLGDNILESDRDAKAAALDLQDEVSDIVNQCIVLTQYVSSRDVDQNRFYNLTEEEREKRINEYVGTFEDNLRNENREKLKKQAIANLKARGIKPRSGKGKNRHRYSESQINEEIENLINEYKREYADKLRSGDGFTISESVLQRVDDLVFFESDTNDQEVFVKKMRNIAELEGIYFDEKEARAQHEKLFDKKTRLLNQRAFEAFRVKYIERVYRANIKKINVLYLENYNSNALAARNKLIDDINSALRIGQIDPDIPSIREELKKKGVLFEDSSNVDKVFKENDFNTKLPIPTFGSKLGEITANNLSLMMSAAGSPIAVSMNGGYTKKNSGFQYLPDTIESDVEPTKMKASELLALVRSEDSPDMSQWRYSTGKPDEKSGKPIMTVINEGKSLEALIDAGDPEVIFYDAELNPHGIDTRFTPVPPGGRAGKWYHRLGELFGLITDNSQENMVIKAKKTLSTKTTITDKKRMGHSPEGVQADLSNSVDARNNMREQFITFRREWLRDIYPVFDDGGVMGDIGFGIDAVRLIVQSLTPGMKVVVKNKNGDTRTFMVDSTNILGSQEKFDERWNEIQELMADDEEFVSASVMTITPEVMSMKISGAFVDSYYTDREADHEAAAVKAAQDWNNYLIDGISCEKIFSRIAPISFAVRDNTVVADSPTADQMLQDAILGEASHGSREYGSRYTRRGCKSAKKDLVESRVNLGKSLFRQDAGKRDICVFKTFIPDLGEMNSLGDYLNEKGEEKVRTEDVAGNENLFYTDDGNVLGVGVVYDMSKIGQALEWGKNTGNKLLIPSNLFDQDKSNEEKYTSYSQTITGNESVKPLIGEPAINYIIIDPVQTSNWLETRGVKYESSNLPYDKEDITALVIDDEDVFQLGDGPIAYTSSAHGITLEEPETQVIPYSSIMDESRSSGLERGKEIVGNSDIPEIIKKLKNENGDYTKDFNTWQKAGFDFSFYSDSTKNIGAIQDRIIDFLKAFETGDVKGGVRQSGSGEFPCVALVQNGRIGDDGPVIAPIMLKANMDFIDGVIIDQKRNNDFIVSYDFKYILGDRNTEYQASKQAGDIAAPDKGMLTPLNPNLYEEPVLEGLDFPNSGKRDIIPEFITSIQTIASRLPGFEENSIKLRMMNFFFKFGYEMRMSALFVYDEKAGLYRWNDYLLQQVKEGKITMGQLNDLANNNSNVWRRVENGDIKLFDPQSPNGQKRNETVQIIAKHCRIRGINPVRVLSSYKPIEDGTKRTVFTDVYNWPMIFSEWGLSDMETYFNMLHEDFCPASTFEEVEDRHLFDHQGRMLLNYRNGRPKKRVIVAWGNHNQIGYQSAKETSGGKKSGSYQLMYRKGQTYGISKRDLPAAVAYSDMLLKHPEHITESFKGRVQEATERPGYMIPGTSESVKYLNELKSDPVATFREATYRRVMNSVGDSYRYPRVVTENGEDIKHPEDDNDIFKIWRDIHDRSNGKINYHFMNVTASFLDGYSWNSGKGETKISKSSLIKDFKRIGQNIREHGLPIVVPEGGYDPDGNRYCLPQMTRDFAEMWYQNDPDIQEYWKNKGGYKAYLDALTAEQDKTEKAIGELDKSQYAKKKALSTACDWVRRQYGQRTKFTRLTGLHWIDELAFNDDTFAAILRRDPSFDIDEYERLCSEQQAAIVRQRALYDKKGQRKRVAVSWTIGGEAVGATSYDNSHGAIKALNGMVDLSIAQSMLNPVVGASNAVTRVVGNTGLNIFMKTVVAADKAGKTLSGNTDVDSIKLLNEDIVELAASDPDLQKLFILHRIAKLTGQETKFMEQVSQAKNIHEFLIEYEELGKKDGTIRGWLSRAVNFGFKMGSGFNIGIKGQLKNFIQRFFMFAQAEGQDFYAATADEEGHNYLEVRLLTEGGPVKWYLDIWGGNKVQTPSYKIAMKALNSSRGPDIAQDSLFSLFYGDLVRKIPVSRFVVQTTFMKFPEYTYNVTGKMLNFCMPVSSIAYWARERAAETKWGEEHNADLVQNHTGLREAVISDILHLGVWPVAAILATLTGALQEPPDKDKKGDPGEWLFFGKRINDNWWIRDTVGLAVPMAEFWITVGQGEPRIDLLVNGFVNVCSNNPLLATPDAINFFLDPEGSFNRGYEQEAKSYEKAPGGAPTAEQWGNMFAATGATSYILQFVTPSFARELYNKLDPYERSYKRVYKEGKEKNLINTERVDFETAKWHQLARRNPVLAAFLDVLPNDDTNYWRTQMPTTGYYDNDQLEAMQYWSVSGLSEEDSQAKCLEIITLLQSYEDMDQLQKTGFYMDTETRRAVSEMVWDIYHEYDEWYYGMQASGNLDNYVLGNGNWSEGNRIKGELTLAWKEGKKYWNDFYNTKIKYSYLSKPMQMYTRYNTTYKQDAKGEIYATGYRNSGAAIFSPVLTAPGSIDNPEGTAGYENDWSSVSAVTGKPLGQRALTPVDMDVEEWPDLKEFGTNNGNGYSQSYNNLYGTGTAAGNSMFGVKSTMSYGGSRGYSGGGGGGRSGGSSGYVPPIYSRVDMPNMPNPAVYRGNKKNNRPDLDYLRPSFETKGSREAYRREDL